MANDVSKNGVFFDNQSQKIVNAPPVEGVQLVPPGGEITSGVQADIDRYTEIEHGEVPEPKTVTTRSAKGDKAAD